MSRNFGKIKLLLTVSASAFQVAACYGIDRNSVTGFPDELESSKHAHQ
jgi:hypothetical protein